MPRESLVTRDDALKFTNAATNHLIRHTLQVGLLQLRWATLVHDTLAFADGMKAEKVDEVLFHFRMFYCMVCAEAGIRPHHLDEVAWREAVAEASKD